MEYGYGTDDGGGDSVGLLKDLTQRFGPVSTFSGSYSAGMWTLSIAGNHSSGIFVEGLNSVSAAHFCIQITVKQI